MADKELMEYMYENMNMGIEALEELSRLLSKTDNKITSNVLKSLESYKEFMKKIKGMDETVPSKKGNLMAVIMSKVGTNTEFMKDNSDSKIAEMLIQGYNMGIIDITKKIKKCDKDASREVLALAKDYKAMMEKGIKDVKGFL